MSDKAYLVLENGMSFEGTAFGAAGQASGELVFTTEMMGYLEALTDPNYHGQIVLQTFPLVGNYGVISEDFLSDSGPAAYIVKHPCQDPSNFRSEGELDTFLRKRGIPGLYGVDTRAIAKIVRDSGTIYGMIAPAKNGGAPAFAATKSADLVADVSAKKVEKFKAEKSGGKTVAVLDFGLNTRHRDALVKRGFDVTVFPHDTAADAILAEKPAGILISDGPGNPEDNAKAVGTVKKLAQSKTPILGVGLGHQLLALSQGFRVEKLKCGHRGASQGVKNLDDGKVYITRQNHGYVVVSNSINKKLAEESFINVNDKTCEGIEYKTIPAFSVQFDPYVSGFVFDKFAQQIKGGSK